MLDLNQIFEAAKVKQDPKAKYFAAEYRTCEDTARFVTAVDASIRSSNVEADKQFRAWQDTESKLRAKIDALRDKLHDSQVCNSRALLEQTELTEFDRDRVLAPLTE